jgi:hypothetical protein
MIGREIEARIRNQKLKEERILPEKLERQRLGAKNLERQIFSRKVLAMMDLSLRDDSVPDSVGRLKCATLQLLESRSVTAKGLERADQTLVATNLEMIEMRKVFDVAF